MEPLKEFYQPFLKRNWHRPMSLVVLVAVLARLPLALGKWVPALVAAALGSFVWIVTNRIPRAPRGTFGFGVAIRCDSEGQQSKVRADFIERVQSLVQESAQLGSLKFLVFEPRVAERLAEGPAAVRWLARRARLLFLLYGRVRQRELDGQSIHVLDLYGLVGHEEVPKELSDKLAGEFASVLPRRLIIPTDNDFVGFEFTADWVDIAAHYVVGVAAFVSRNLGFAESVLLALEKRLAMRPDVVAPGVKIVASVFQSDSSRSTTKPCRHTHVPMSETVTTIN